MKSDLDKINLCDQYMNCKGTACNDTKGLFREIDVSVFQKYVIKHELCNLNVNIINYFEELKIT